MRSVCLKDADISRIKNIFKRYDEVLEEIKGLTSEDVEKDAILAKAVKLDLAQIGEHIKHLPSNVKSYFTPMEYDSMMKMRNLISHEYETVKFNIIYNTLRDVVTPAISRFRSSELIKKNMPN